MLPRLVEIKSDRKFKAGDRVVITKITGGWLQGDLVYGYLKKFIGMHADVLDYRNTRFQNVKIQPITYKGFLWVNEEDICLL